MGPAPSLWSRAEAVPGVGAQTAIIPVLLLDTGAAIVVVGAVAAVPGAVLVPGLVCGGRLLGVSRLLGLDGEQVGSM